MKKTNYRRPRRERRDLKAEMEIKQLLCSKCKTVFPDYLARCPECGSEDWVGYTEINPYTRLPLESFLKVCGHLLWICGTFGFLTMLWQTTSPNVATNKLFIYAGIASILLGVIFSAAYFGLSEIMKRILRIQRRLRAFHENYRESDSAVQRKSTPKKPKKSLLYPSPMRKHK